MEQKEVSKTIRMGGDEETFIKPSAPAPSPQDIITWEEGQVIEGLYKINGHTEGGMGAVYFVDHLKWKIPLAVKTPLPELVANETTMKRFIREAEVWVDLGMHPNIATCFYVRQIGGLPRIFIEYVEGGNLKDWIKDGRVKEWKDILDLTIQICQGMEYAHKKGVIHRDIKPANCLMTGDGVLKITDFGLVKDTGVIEIGGSGVERLQGKRIEEGSLTMVGGGIGTPEYMSPEQFERAKEAGKEADIYSFGVMLFEMVCGKRPFIVPDTIHPSARAVLYKEKHQKEMPPEPISLREDCARPLNDLILKCLEKDPERRMQSYPSFESIRRELESLYQEILKGPYPRMKAEDIKLKADSLNNRAASCLDLNREDEAVKYWQEALKEDPQHLEANFNLGYLRWQKEEITGDAYVTQLRDLESSKGANPDYWCFLAWIHLERGDIKELERIQTEHRVGDFLKALLDKKRPFRFSRSFVGHTNSVSSVSFSPDGRYALSGSADKTLRLWEIASGREVRRFEGHTGYVSSVSFSPDGRYALSGGKMLVLYSRSLWEKIVKLDDIKLDDIDTLISSERKSDDKTLRLWEVASGREMRRFEGHTGDVSSVSFSPDGRYALSGSSDKTLRLWEVAASGREVRQFKGHMGSVTSVSFSPDGRYALSGSDDHTLRLWEVASGREVRRFEGHTDNVSSVSFSPDGRYALSGSEDNILGLWEVYYSEEEWRVYPLLCRARHITSLAEEQKKVKGLIKSVMDSIEEGSYQNAYRLLREVQSVPGYEREREVLGLLTLCGVRGGGRRSGLKGAWHLHTFEGHTGGVTSVSFSPDGRYALSASDDMTIRLWDISNGLEIRKLEGHTNKVASVSFSPDGRYALSGSYDKTIRLWDISSGHEIKRLEGYTEWVYSVSFSPDGCYALSGGYGRTVRLWDISSGREIRGLEGHTKMEVYSVSFSPDGRYALSASWDRTVRLWEVASGREKGCFEGHTNKVASACFSPDGRYALSASWDGTVKLWDISSGREINKFEGQPGKVTSVSFSPDGRYALSGSDDKTLRLWDISSGREIRKLEGHTSEVASVSFSPDGRYALSGSGDKTLRLWEFDWELEFCIRS